MTNPRMTLLDLDRKEELILQKQIRQSTSRMMGNQNTRLQNLPTLIEASPDFSQKKLPYLPNLPASVQLANSGSIYGINDVMSIASSEGIQSLYSVPTKKKYRNIAEKPESVLEEDEEDIDDRRRGRSSSISFDFDHSLKRRNSSKNSKDREKEKTLRKDKEKKQKSTNEKSPLVPHRESSDRRKESSKSGKKKQQTFDDQEPILSMWACCKCTLENPLTEPTCQACGGSRLISIGEIQVTEFMIPTEIVNNNEGNTGEEVQYDKWKCVICTLENEAMAFYCDACNSENPIKDEKVQKQTEKKAEGPKTAVKEVAKETVTKLPRYFGIFCFLAILFYSSMNALFCLYALLEDIAAVTPDLLKYVPSMPSYNANDQHKTDDESASSALSDGLGFILETNTYGLNFLLFGVFYVAAFFLMATKLRPTQAVIAPRVPMPM